MKNPMLPKIGPVPVPRPDVQVQNLTPDMDPNMFEDVAAPTPSPALIQEAPAITPDLNPDAFETVVHAPVATPEAPPVFLTGASPDTNPEMFDRIGAKPAEGFLNNIGAGMADAANRIVGGFGRGVGVLGGAAGEGSEASQLPDAMSLPPDEMWKVLSTPAGQDQLANGPVMPDPNVAPPIQQAGDAFGDMMNNVDTGYRQQTTWDDVKGNPLPNLIPYIAETGLISVPDMIAAINPATLAPYILSRTADMANQRAEADGRQTESFTDMLTTAPGAVVSALLDRFSGKSMAGLTGDVALNSMKQVPKAALQSGGEEAVTEAAQQATEDLSTYAGTKQGITPDQVVDNMAGAAVAGGGFGTGVRAGTGSLEVLSNRGAPAAPVPPVEPPPAPVPPEPNPPAAPVPPLEPGPVPGPAPVPPVEPPAAPVPPAGPAPQPPAPPVEPAPPAPVPPVTPPEETDFEPIPPEPAPAPEPAPVPPVTPPAPEPEVAENPLPSADKGMYPGVKQNSEDNWKPGEAGPVIQKTWKDISSGKVDPEVEEFLPKATKSQIARHVKNPSETDTYTAIGMLRDLALAQGNLATMRNDLNGEAKWERYADVLTKTQQALQNDEMFGAQRMDKTGVQIAETIAPWAKQFVQDMTKQTGFDLSMEVIDPKNVPAGHYLATHPDGIEAIDAINYGGTFGMIYRHGAPGGKMKMYYVLRNGQKQPTLHELETAAHEFGHAAQVQFFDTLPAQDKMNILSNYADWALSTKPTMAMFDRKGIHGQQYWQDRKWERNANPKDYDNSFSEWFADQSARWLTTNKPAKTTMDKFFKAVAAMWRQLYAVLNKNGYVSDGVEKLFRDAMKASAAKAKAKKKAGKNEDATTDPSAFADVKDLPPLPDKPNVKADPEPTPADGPNKSGDPTEQVGKPTSGSKSEDKTRRSSGAMTPGFTDVSFTNERSLWEGAFTDAGMTPDEGMLLKPEQKKNILARLLSNTFGIKMDVSGDMLIPEAVNQMLDAYKNVRFMLHTLGLPLKALGLNGTLTLSLERFKGAYLGAYDGSTKTIHMPGRSNSFAHEWMHALDGFLADNVKPHVMARLLSRITRNEGLDPTNSMQEAFINLVHKLVFEDTALALKIMQLEKEANQTIKKGPNAGQLTAKAKEAQVKLDRLKAGATRINIQGSNFKGTSQSFGRATGGNGGAAYYGSVHELMARAFEAWIAHKVENAGGTNEFITKGNNAYLSNEDPRLRMTFPKASERLEIFDAFEKLFDHIRLQAMLGTDPAADKPADENAMDANFWNKVVTGTQSAGTNPFIEEWNHYRNAAANTSAGALTAALKASAASVAQAPKAVASFIKEWGGLYTRSYRAIIKSMIKRNEGKGSAFMQVLANKFMTDIGVGARAGETSQKETFEDEVIAAERKADGRLLSVLNANGFLNGLLKPFGMRETIQDADNKIIRGLLYGDPVTGATAAHKAVAAEIRRMFEDAFIKLTNSGVKLGYVKDTGYLPRILRIAAVAAEPMKFIMQATKAYKIQFDNLTKDWDTDLNADETIDLINQVAARRAGQKDQIRELAKPIRAEVKKLDAGNGSIADLEAAIRQALDDLRDPYSEYAAEDWQERILMGTSVSYDSHGPDSKFTKPRTLPPEADKLLEDFYEQDVLAATINYTSKATRKAAYVDRFGTSGGNDSWEALLQRKVVKNMMANNPTKYNPNTVQGQLNILRDLTDKTKDNLIELYARMAVKDGADYEDVRFMRDAVEEVTGMHQPKGAMAARSRVASGAITTLTFLSLLGRAAQTGLIEPATIIFRSGSMKAAGETFLSYMGEIANVLSGDKIQSVRQRAELARAIGLIASPLLDAIQANRFNEDFQDMSDKSRMWLASFFRANGLTQMTNAQRRSAMAGGHVWLGDMAKTWSDSKTKASDKKVIEAEWKELGIDPKDFADFADWLNQTPDLPSVDDLDSKEGQLWASAVRRIADTVIQEPRRMDKPVYATSPTGRLVYALMSFSYAFFRNVHMATINRTKRNYEIRRGEGDSVGSALLRGSGDVMLTAGLGFATMMAGQMMLAAVRSALFAPEQWDDKEKKGELAAWLFWQSASRSGVFGPADVINNAITGVRYERDLTSLAAGPGLGLWFSMFQNLASVSGAGAKNSPNTNTAERQFIKSFYMAVASPTINAVASSIPAAGPLSWLLRYGIVAGLTSQGAASSAADMLAGEQTQKQTKKSPYE